MEALHDSLAVHTSEKGGLKARQNPFKPVLFKAVLQGLGQY